MSIKKNLRDTLLDGLEQLVREGSNKKFWYSTRSVADSLIALNFCLPTSEFMKLKLGALDFMLKEGDRTQREMLNWNEEVWDTSIAAMALAAEPVKFHDEIGCSIKWISSKYLKIHTSWNEEIWETLLALNCIAYLTQTNPAINHRDLDFSGAVEWLIKMIDTPRKGVLINWSSTALFVLLAHSPSLPGVKDELKAKVKDYGEKCARAIFEADIMTDDDVLWTSEAWSNGLVIWAISVSKIGILNVNSAFKVTRWFKERIAAKDLPTEDRAFSCIGLYKYLEYLETSAINILHGRNEMERDNAESQLELLIDGLQEKIATNLKLRVGDYQSQPPVFTRTSFLGYYSFNLRATIINIALILGLTAFLSYLTWQTQAVQDTTLKWLVLVPIVLGTLATVAQLANFNLIPKRSSAVTEDDDE